MAFVNERHPVVCNDIFVRCVRSLGHQYNGWSTIRREIHSALKAYSLALAHFEIRNNFVGHKCCRLKMSQQRNEAKPSLYRYLTE